MSGLARWCNKGLRSSTIKPWVLCLMSASILGGERSMVRRRRVAYEPSSDEFVVLDQTLEGIFHGHVRAWSDLHTDMQNALVRQGVVNRRGRPTG